MKMRQRKTSFKPPKSDEEILKEFKVSQKQAHDMWERIFEAKSTDPLLLSGAIRQCNLADFAVMKQEILIRERDRAKGDAVWKSPSLE